MGKIGAIAVGLVFSGLTVGLTGCEKGKTHDFPHSEELLSEYVSSDSEVDSIAAGWRKGGIGFADAQSSVDSAAYRSIFNSTEAAKDSQKVAEFNRIAAQNRAPEYVRTDIAANMHFERKLRFKNLPLNEYKAINNYIGSRGITSDSVRVGRRQFVADSIAYGDFFKKHNLATDTVVNKIKYVSRKIKP